MTKCCVCETPIQKSSKPLFRDGKPICIFCDTDVDTDNTLRKEKSACNPGGG